MRMNRVSWPQLVLLALVLTVFTQISSEAKKPPPFNPQNEQIDVSAPIYAGSAGGVVLKALSEIKTSAEHYNAEAESYDRAILGMRIIAFLCSVFAAVVLALSGAEWARRTALVLSVVLATIPAADQIFQVSEMHRASWRAAVDAARLFEQCKDTWELYAPAIDNNKRESSATDLVAGCRKQLSALIDAGLEVSTKPLQLPLKAESK
jgi:hypothetical protein